MPGRPSCFSDQSENTNLVEDVKNSLPAHVLLNSIQRFQRKSRKCHSQSEARAAILLLGYARKHKLSRGHWDLASCQVLLNIVQWFHGRSNISTSSTKFVFFRAIGKTRLPPWPLIGWDIFDFFSEMAEWNSTKLDSKQDLNVLYHVCVFRADRKNRMAALASDWLRHFRLLLWDCWTEFNETCQEARS